MERIRIGSILVSRVPEVQDMPIPGAIFYNGYKPDSFARAREWLDGRFVAPDAEDVILSFHSYVIQSGGRNILVDACHGNDKKRAGPLSYCAGLQTDYLDRLANAGFTPEDIDIVLCTHLHFDHVGWNTRLENGRWVPTFPNARYLMSRADYDHFARATDATDGSGAHPFGSFNDSVLPVVEAGQADFVPCDHVIERELGQGLWLEGAAGHTPGCVMLHARSGGESALFSGDVIHHPMQLSEPDLHVVGEYDSAEATRVRRRVLETYADSPTVLLTAHFPAPTAGRVVRHGDAFRFRFLAD